MAAAVHVLARLDACHVREAALLAEAKSRCAQGLGDVNEAAAELRRLQEQKRELLDVLICCTQLSPPPTIAAPPQLLQVCWEGSEMQVPGTVVSPAPVVTISNWAILARSTIGSFVLSASVVSADGSAAVNAPLDGVSSQPVDPHGIVCFSAMKFPTWNNLQSSTVLTMQFILQETSGPSVRSISTVTSKSFAFVASSAHLSPAISVSSASSLSASSLLSRSTSPTATLMAFSPFTFAVPAPVLQRMPSPKMLGGNASLRASSSSDSLFSSGDDDMQGPPVELGREGVDITDLLLLPQKIAAQRLGLSESMLCKRFKEATRRKWPYRSVQKLDKLISALRHAEHADGGLLVEDRTRLETLLGDRERCLRPVRIRIGLADRAEANALESLQLLSASHHLK